MSEDCTHDCGSCSENCGSREQNPADFLEAPHEASTIKKLSAWSAGKAAWENPRDLDAGRSARRKGSAPRSSMRISQGRPSPRCLA